MSNYTWPTMPKAKAKVSRTNSPFGNLSKKKVSLVVNWAFWGGKFGRPDEKKI